MQGGSPEIGFQRSKPAALIRGFIYGTRTQWFFLNSPSKSPFLVIQIPNPSEHATFLDFAALEKMGGALSASPGTLQAQTMGRSDLLITKNGCFQQQNQIL
jgi:hypothetical protein